MAIFYCQMSVVSRSSGRSAVAAAAYRCAEKLTNERDGLVHDYTRKEGVEHSEIVLPEAVNADWAKDRSALWNAAEASEKRKDARVAREFVIALPHELSEEGRLELTREFAQDLANRYGAAVDFAIHAPHAQGDVRNHHAHVMMTTRQVTESGFGDKTMLELANKDLLPQGLPTTQMQLVDIRRGWEGMANERLALEGHDIRIDHRSHSERGLEIEPTEHMGVASTNMQRRGGQVDRARLDDEAAQRNADLIREKPEQVLTLLTNEKSVFDRRDIARTLHRYINDDAQTFQNAFASVMASPALAELQPERVDPETGEVSLARYSTKEMVEIETGMARSAAKMAEAHSHGVDRRHVDRAMERQDAAIRKGSGDESARLSDEQRHAIEHITGPERISAVVGFAGAGKSTMLAAAREAWEAEGYKVHGAALSGKAAEGLEESSGIESRTLASWSRGWERDRNTIGRGDVFVIDEAGMVGSRQLAGFITEAEARGAKIVLVGDHEQLQAIGAGAPFRAIAEQIGHAELTDIRRQREGWQREASVSFATHKTAEGLAAYRDHGDVHFAASGQEARAEIVRDYLADREQRPDSTRVAMAHRRVDVRALNADIRSELQARGDLVQGEDNGERTFQTNDGQRSFAPGDRLVFLENNRDLGVKNGMLGTVETVKPDGLDIRLDGGSADRAETARMVSVAINDYQAIDHGYATTIHKNQGATVDRAYVLASGSMDRHLTYVAMTRHRDGAQLYASAEEFADRNAGKLVEHGAAPFEHKDSNSQSYFVTLENAKGERHTTWGVDLGRAMAEAKPEIGATIGLRHEGSVPVTLPDGTETHRNAWKVQDAGDLAYQQLESRLSRSGAKETTLDYIRDFAERRGIAEHFGVSSDIDLTAVEKQAQDMPSRAAQAVREQQDRSSERFHSPVGRTPSDAGPVRREDPAQDIARSADARLQPEKRRRGMFDGLKLSRGREAAKDSQQERTEDASVSRKEGRSMFDGLKLTSGRTGRTSRTDRIGRDDRDGPQAQDRPMRSVRPDRETPSLGVSQQEPSQDGAEQRVAMERAVDRYAHAYGSIQRQEAQKLPVLDNQKAALQDASDRLDRLEAGSSDILASALKHDPHTAKAMTERSGGERATALIEGMEREKVQQQDPNVRAGRFVKEWQGLSERREDNDGFRPSEIAARKETESQMRDMVERLEKDPAMENALRQHGRDLGIRSHLREEQKVSQELEKNIQRGPEQGLGM